jgi:hypothetical protein
MLIAIASLLLPSQPSALPTPVLRGSVVCFGALCAGPLCCGGDSVTGAQVIVQINPFLLIAMPAQTLTVKLIG